jgi:hypothetical protein
MTSETWLKAALADADTRGLPALKPLLEGLAKLTEQLRAADFNDLARRGADGAEEAAKKR